MAKFFRPSDSVARRAIVSCGVAVVVLLGLVEVAVRASGLVDFPTYSVDGEIGYVLNASQSGAFLNKNRWAFNDRAMGVARPWDPRAGRDLPLIGNSVIMGGNPYDQAEKVGPLVQDGLGADWAVWPMAAGGWTEVNETVFVERNPDVVAAARFFVWECMAGGLSSATPWAGDYLWPRERPAWAGWYVFRRYVVPRLLPVNTNELPVVGALDPAALRRFEDAVGRLSQAAGGPTPGMLLLYPKKAELALARQGREWLPERAALTALALRHHLLIVDVAADPRWNETLYRPDEVHPLVAGNRVLSAIIIDAVRKAAAS